MPPSPANRAGSAYSAASRSDRFSRAHVNQDEELQLRLRRVVRLIADLQFERTGETPRFDVACQNRRAAWRYDDHLTARRHAIAASLGLMQNEPSPAAIAHEKVCDQGIARVNCPEIMV